MLGRLDYGIRSMGTLICAPYATVGSISATIGGRARSHRPFCWSHTVARPSGRCDRPHGTVQVLSCVFWTDPGSWLNLRLSPPS